MVISFHTQNTYRTVIPQHLNELSMVKIKYKYMYHIYMNDNMYMFLDLIFLPLLESSSTGIPFSLKYSWKYQ